MLLIGFSGCAVVRSAATVRIALLAPFEGRYREIGYNALYAARLAQTDFGDEQIELLAVDDGGAAESAADRAHALAQDPQVKAVIALGYASTGENVQQAFEDMLLLIVGSWSAQPQSNSAFVLSSSELDAFLTAPAAVDVVEAAILPAPVIGGDVFALAQFSKLRSNLNDVTVVSSAGLPDEQFSERYRNSGQFAPSPGLLATLTYDATTIAMLSTQSTDPIEAVRTIDYEGLNGSIQFEDGYWADAPIHFYVYASDKQLMEIQAPNAESSLP